MRAFLLRLAVAVWPIVGAPIAGWAQTEVDLELVLLADSTGSIGDDEIRFQRQGYADALTDPDVIAAIGSTLTGSIALTYIEWGAAGSQQIVVDWRVITDADSAGAFAEALMLPPRLARGRNAVGAALLFGRDRIDANEIRGLRRIIDLSADSVSNFNGPSIASARDEVLAGGITINGLAVLCRICTSGRAGSADLEAEFASGIIGGPGAFVVTADSSASFAEAVKRKLILEIAGLRPDMRVARGE